MSTWVVDHGMVATFLVPEVFPTGDISMQAHVFFGDTWHHPYISTCFCVNRFYFLYISPDKTAVHRVSVGLAQAVYPVPIPIPTSASEVGMEIGTG